jgi:hypothetical protein
LDINHQENDHLLGVFVNIYSVFFSRLEMGWSSPFTNLFFADGLKLSNNRYEINWYEMGKGPKKKESNIIQDLFDHDFRSRPNPEMMVKGNHQWPNFSGQCTMTIYPDPWTKIWDVWSAIVCLPQLLEIIGVPLTTKMALKKRGAVWVWPVWEYCGVLFGLPSRNWTCGKLPMCRGFSYWKWWFSTAMQTANIHFFWDVDSMIQSDGETRSDTTTVATSNRRKLVSVCCFYRWSTSAPCCSPMFTCMSSGDGVRSAGPSPGIWSNAMFGF